MPRKKKKSIGIGAVCEVLKRFLHPRPVLSQKYPNAAQQDRLQDLLVIKKEVRKVNKVDRVCIVFRHNDFEGQELYCAERYSSVITEGAEADFFVDDSVVEAEVVEAEVVVEEAEEVPKIHASDLAENIARLRAEGYGVDDDNEPAPENIPSVESALPAPSAPGCIYKEWNSTTICNRLVQGLRHEKAKLGDDIDPSATYIDYFIYFLPVTYIKEILIIQTNKQGKEEDIMWGKLLFILVYGC